MYVSVSVNLWSAFAAFVLAGAAGKIVATIRSAKSMTAIDDNCDRVVRDLELALKNDDNSYEKFSGFIAGAFIAGMFTMAIMLSIGSLFVEGCK